jgi:integrase
MRCLKWSEVNLDRCIANLSDSKTGPSVRPLSSAAVEIIQRQPRNGEYVFGLNHGRPISNLTPYWSKLGMDKTISPHTSRHSFASLAADVGISDHLIAGMLGHSRQNITSRYMHLSDRALVETADRVADATLKLMKK